MFQNLLVSNYVPLPMKDELKDWENQPFSSVWPEKQDVQQKNVKEEPIKKTIFKKKKRFRTAFTTQQLRALEDVYRQRKYIDGDSRRKLAKCLNIADVSVKTWFQNRRMKEKREDTETSDTSSECLGLSSPVQIQKPNQYFEQYENSSNLKVSIDLLKRHSPVSSETYVTSTCPDVPSYESSNYNIQNAPNYNQIIPPTFLPQQVENFNFIENYSPHEVPNNTEVFGHQFPSYLPSYHMPDPAANRDFFNENNTYPTQYYPMNSDHYSNHGYLNYNESVNKNNWY